jgi:hypothetical protein
MMINESKNRLRIVRDIVLAAYEANGLRELETDELDYQVRNVWNPALSQVPDNDLMPSYVIAVSQPVIGHKFSARDVRDAYFAKQKNRDSVPPEHQPYKALPEPDFDYEKSNRLRREMMANINVIPRCECGDVCELDVRMVPVSSAPDAPTCEQDFYICESGECEFEISREAHFRSHGITLERPKWRKHGPPMSSVGETAAKITGYDPKASDEGHN